RFGASIRVCRVLSTCTPATACCPGTPPPAPVARRASGGAGEPDDHEPAAPRCGLAGHARELTNGLHRADPGPVRDAAWYRGDRGGARPVPARDRIDVRGVVPARPRGAGGAGKPRGMHYA